MAESVKTARILVVYHLLVCCEEVSFKEVSDTVSVCKKTFYRDICLLKQLGFQIEYRKKSEAFVMLPEKQTPRFPENKTQKKRFQRILRLTDMMSNMDRAEDPAAWYRDKYPELGARTMQRDFKTLCSIGYTVKYTRGGDEWEEHQPYKYYCEWPDTWGVYVPGKGV